jgi:hypothetical protein
VNTREHCCVWYQRCSEVLITVATKKQCLPFENGIKYREEIVTPTFKITLYILDFKLSPCFEYCMYSFGYIYISQTRLNSMKTADLSTKVSNNMKPESGQIMHHEGLTEQNYEY